MVMSNPRESGLWTPRTQEFTGGYNGREILDYDINPNEDNDGLSHHSLKTPEDEESVAQLDPKKRRERALRELATHIPHVSLKPVEIDDILGRTPQNDGMQQLLESGLGVDMGQMANGGSLAAGANAGPIRSPTGQISYQSDIGKEDVWDDAFPEDARMWAKGVLERVRAKTGMRKDDEVEVMELVEQMLPQIYRLEAQGRVPFLSSGWIKSRVEEILRPYGIDTKSSFQRLNRSEEEFVPLSDIIKAKRKYKGRRYTDDEESDEDERRSKARHKRKKKRRGGKKSAGGSREPKSKSKRRAKSTERNLSRSSKQQAFNPNVHSHAMRSLGSGRSDQLPLRLRDPVAYQRKLAAEKFRRQMGALPRGLSAHADTRGITSRGTVIGQKAPKAMGTSLSPYKFRASEGAIGDPLGTKDFIKSKRKTVSSLDIAQLRAMLKRLEQKLNKLTKAPAELNDNAKRGSQASEERSSDPGANGATQLNHEERAGYRVEDPTIMMEAYAIGKR